MSSWTSDDEAMAFVRVRARKLPALKDRVRWRGSWWPQAVGESRRLFWSPAKPIFRREAALSSCTPQKPDIAANRPNRPVAG